ncbi:16S rRNA (guanine(527)-N(7))-methyltransferase RsmG [Sphingomonas panacisoli]|uniref:Ribosomal RNA small subunit methyltransferase G n=1 Tax=Sphingomonas panacisoli TaxID=1813879 RepID=A0A5B8LL87_9SPHN|nr:16S rRNA (guanine(527)-N(7))-methyltransferase RsmG [Sphingomonas panacisoli]QDZ08846.1 16S rRNA (guanine(527)-N(7))-methyltransferase RsmG [Sphingomonas panacisoli]
MTEEDARAWAVSRFDSAAIDRLDSLAAIVAEEAERQNLIARSTLASIWTRHIVDSLQLVALGPDGIWLDVGAGAGFPGLAVAAVEPERAMILVEPRRLRADYLRDAANQLGLTNVTVIAAKVEAVSDKADVISARAVARIGALLASAAQCAKKETVWLLPKGRNADDEVAEARRTWHGVFHVEHSITSPDSAIVIARGVRRR